MTTLTFPALPSGTLPDSSKYELGREDVAIRDETEGGYVITRPRHTRKPRRSWKIGYTFIDNADKQALDAFWDTTLGSSRIFNWTDPDTLTVFQVRFKEAISFQYVGKGTMKRWDCAFQLEQA